MKQYLKKTLCASLFFSLSAHAQVSPEILRKYPAHVVSAIASIIIRAKLPIEKQAELARYYLRQDSLAELKRIQGGAPAEISRLYALNTQELALTLTPLQLCEFYSSEVNANTSELEKAVKYRRELELNLKQAEALAWEYVKAKIANVPTTPQIKSGQILRLRQVLNKVQFEQYFKVINKDRASAATHNYWAQLKQFGLVKNTDSSSINRSIYEFALKQFTDIDRTSFENPEKLDSIKKAGSRLKPYLLFKLEAYKGTLSPIYLVSDIISRREKLMLSSNQIDSLLINNIDTERKRSASPVRYAGEYVPVRSEEMTAILRVLNNEQYQFYLESKNSRRAQYNADNDWLALKKAGLISPVIDQSKITAENQEYELRWLVANERLANDRNQANLFAKQEVENHKPELLRKLEAMNNETVANKRLKDSLTW